MAAGPATAIVSLCVPLEATEPARGTGPAITWVAPLEKLAAGSDRPGHALALRLDPAWLDSKRALRDSVRAARSAVPDLTAAVLGGTALRHHDLLAAEGMRVVVVDSFAEIRHGSRRPSPAGWPCRNVAWGLWEVRLAGAREGRSWIWPWPTGGLPAPRRGGLHVLAADARARPDRQVDLWSGWAARHAARIVVVPVAALPDIFEGSRAESRGGSILRAA